jgi:hypothetical protein
MAEDKSKSLSDLISNITTVIGFLIDSDGFKKNMRDKIFKKQNTTNNPASKLPGKSKNNTMSFENSPDGSMDQKYFF